MLLGKQAIFIKTKMRDFPRSCYKCRFYTKINELRFCWALHGYRPCHVKTSLIPPEVEVTIRRWSKCPLIDGQDVKYEERTRDWQRAGKKYRYMKATERARLEREALKKGKVMKRGNFNDGIRYMDASQRNAESARTNKRPTL